jgi:hypothetical protein
MIRLTKAKKIQSLVCGIGVALVCLGVDSDRVVADEVSTQPVTSFEKDVRPLLRQYCDRCHNAEKHHADLRLNRLDPDMVSGSDAETWHDVLNKINQGEMPPAKAEQLTAEHRRILVDWLTAELKRAVDVRRSTGGRVVLRRLTRYEYQNTMRDLLGLDLNYAGDLPPESSSADGFHNNGAALGISPLQIEYYLKAARSALGKAIVSGTQPETYRVQREIKPKSAQPDKNPKKKKKKKVNLQADRLLADSNTLYQLKVDKFPRQGDVIVRVTAAAEVPDGAGYPQLHVSLGVKADTESPERVLAVADVTASVDEPQTFEFRGRIEDFPLPGHNPKFPGLAVNLRNVYGGAYTRIGRTSKQGSQNKGELPAIVLKSIEFVGPIESDWPPLSHTRILFARTDDQSDDEYVHEVVTRFMRRAYRRPVSDSDVDIMMSFFDRLRPHAASLEEAVRETLAMVLVSPEFLYLIEPRQVESKREPLGDHELASRLSYFLWCSMPDDELSRLADNGTLRRPDILREQVQRMIADQRSWQLVANFSDQWLDLSGTNRVAVNPQFYPTFDDHLKEDMRLETQHFFAEILHNDLSALNLIASDFVMLNRPLAQHYGIDGPMGRQFERVALSPDQRRGGLLTQGSFLLANSNGEDSHPIRRAVWVLDRLLDDPPPPPPPDVPDLDPKSPNFAGLSLKQQLELHREKEACNNCHRGIDPWGVAFESYDAVGLWRTEVRGRNRKPAPVDTSLTLPDGNELNGVQQLQDYLLTHKRQRFARSIVKRLLTYGLGRSVELADEATVDELTARFEKDDYRLGKLIADIVASQPFQTK